MNNTLINVINKSLTIVLWVVYHILCSIVLSEWEFNTLNFKIMFFYNKYY